MRLSSSSLQPLTISGNCALSHHTEAKILEYLIHVRLDIQRLPLAFWFPSSLIAAD